MADQTKTGENNTNDERAQRRARRQALIDAGVNPYPIASEVTAHAAQLEKDYASLPDGEDTQDVVSVAGRIRALRRQGKVAFIVLEDVTGQIQLFCRVNDLGEEGWGLLRQLDLGDIIDATGRVLRTRRGQLSIAPTKLALLSKSLRPLPEKFHGLTDREVRYRQRYVDLIMNPEVRDVFRVPKVGNIAGCYITEGEISRDDKVRVVRDSKVIYEGKISSLRRFKDDVKSVKQGYECGIGVDGYQDIKVGDVIEGYRTEEVERTE